MLELQFLESHGQTDKKQRRGGLDRFDALHMKLSPCEHSRSFRCPRNRWRIVRMMKSLVVLAITPFTPREGATVASAKIVWHSYDRIAKKVQVSGKASEIGEDVLAGAYLGS